MNECRIKFKEFSFYFWKIQISIYTLRWPWILALYFISVFPQTKHFRLLFYRLLVDPHSFTASWCWWVVTVVVVRCFWCCILALLLVMPENAHLIFLIQTYNLILKMNLKRIFCVSRIFFVFTYAVLNSELSFQWKDIQI